VPLLNAWKARGWVDADGAASRASAVLLAGGTPRDAAKEVSGAFLGKNNAQRADVVAVIAGVAPERPKRRAVVLTALPVEYKAVRARLSGLERARTRTGTRFEIGSVTGESIDWGVAVAQIGAGNLGAAAETTQAIVEFDPDLVLFVGVAGAVDTALEIGTVVVADKVAHYEGGKAERDVWNARPLTFKTHHRLGQLASAVARDRPHPIVVKPIAAGEALVKSERSQIGEMIKLHYNDAVAVDMESAGMYDAAHRADKPTLAVRGISDHLDDKDSESDKRDQPLAAERAALFAAELLRVAEALDFPSTK